MAGLLVVCRPFSTRSQSSVNSVNSVPSLSCERVEVTVGDRDHPRPRARCASRNVGQHQRARRDVGLDAGERAEFHRAADHRLNLGDARRLRQPSRSPMIAGWPCSSTRPNQATWPVCAIGDFEIVVAPARADRVPSPSPSASWTLFSVNTTSVGQRQAREVARRQRLEVGFGLGVERLARGRSRGREFIPRTPLPQRRARSCRCARPLPSAHEPRPRFDAAGIGRSIAGRNRPSATERPDFAGQLVRQYGLERVRSAAQGRAGHACAGEPSAWPC